MLGGVVDEEVEEEVDEEEGIDVEDVEVDDEVVEVVDDVDEPVGGGVGGPHPGVGSWLQSQSSWVLESELFLRCMLFPSWQVRFQVSQFTWSAVEPLGYSSWRWSPVFFRVKVMPSWWGVTFQSSVNRSARRQIMA